MKTSTSIFTGVVTAFAIISFFVLIPNASTQSSAGMKLPQSRLGMKGIMGYIITSIDSGSSVEQAGIKVGDIITRLDGQVTGIEEFQGKIFNSAPGTKFEVTYLRFNPATGSYDEHNVTLKTMPFKAQAKATFKNASLAAKGFSSTFTLDCPSGCCDSCEVLGPVDQRCLFGDSFTGKSACRDNTGRCEFSFCT